MTGWIRHLLAAGLLGLAAAAGAAGPPSAPPGWMAVVRDVAPGVRYWRLERGAAQHGTRLDVVVGSSSRQAQADLLVGAVESAEFDAAVIYRSGRYEVRVVGLADRAAAESVRAALAATALGADAAVVESAHDLASPGGPWVAHFLETDPAAVEVRSAHARDASFGLERTSDLARRQGALAAINGGFYQVAGALPGESTGTFAMAGALLSEPDRGRGSVGFFTAEGRVRTLFGRPRFCATATLASGDQIAVDGIDRRRGAKEAIVYTPSFHRTTLTVPDGVEAIVVDGRVAEVRRPRGSSRIPERGFVLSLGAARVAEDGVELRVGERVSLELRLLPRGDDPAGEWHRARSIVSAGPLLLAGGAPVGRPELESISQAFARARHPRTAVGARADGTLLFVAVEGRLPERSVGMSLAELTDFLRALGAVEALNLDGGGSTAMVVGGELVTAPSDREGERANGDALLLFAAGSARD